MATAPLPSSSSQRYQRCIPGERFALPCIGYQLQLSRRNVKIVAQQQHQQQQQQQQCGPQHRFCVTNLAPSPGSPIAYNPPARDEKHGTVQHSDREVQPVLSVGVIARLAEHEDGFRFSFGVSSRRTLDGGAWSGSRSMEAPGRAHA
uniref:Uncharacterized protein n=1 Tax=Anopheles merus TaxID=30066 RepID=A0A182V0W9_ANOME